MKRLLTVTLALALLLCLSAAAFAAVPEDFSDFPDNWSSEALTAALENGLLQGHNGMIDPQGYLTRAQMAAILIRAMGGENTADISAFGDVDPSAWYYQSLAVAVRMGLFQGDGSNLTPNNNITREQAALVLSRMFKLDESPGFSTYDLSGYRDEAAISDWAYDGVAAMVEAGYMQGSGGALNPKGHITRAEFAQLMHNMIHEYIVEPGNYSPTVEGNVVIRSTGVDLRGAKISGDVIVGYGVGDGDAHLVDCQIGGRLVVRGGGVNSVYIGCINADPTIVARPDGQVRLVIQGKCATGSVFVSKESAGAVVEVISSAPVALISTAAPGAAVTVGGGATVTDIQVGNNAAAATVTVAQGGAVNTVQIAATQVTVTGGGQVSQVNVGTGAKNTIVNTPHTPIANGSSAPVTTNYGDVPPGGANTTDNQGGISSGSTPGAGTGGGGSGDGGATTTYYQLSLSLSGDGKTVSAETTSNYLAGSASFYAEVIQLLNAKRNDVKAAFGNPFARQIMDDGIAAWQGGNETWKAYLDAYYDEVDGAMAIFYTRNVTMSQMTGQYVLKFTEPEQKMEYTVTIKVQAR